MSESTPTLFTIGHSDHEWPEFVDMLRRHGITAVADVRSSPYSRLHPQYCREVMTEALRNAGMRYVFLGRELGARRSEREAYISGQARYDLVARLPAFQEGLVRLRTGSAKERIALVCAEKDPLTCHRTILVARHLRRELHIVHILEDGSTETQVAAEVRLIDFVGLHRDELFRSADEILEQAYDIQGKKIAFTEADEAAPGSLGRGVA